MVDKTEVIEGWPLETGDYAVGEPQCPVAVVTLGSKMNDEVIKEGAAIAGPLHTENLDEISEKINECIENDPGCFEKDPIKCYLIPTWELFQNLT